MRNSGPIKKNSDTISSYIVDHMEVLLHIYDTFYDAVMYHIVNLYVNYLILNLWEVTIFKMVFLHSAAVSWLNVTYFCILLRIDSGGWVWYHLVLLFCCQRVTIDTKMLH